MDSIKLLRDQLGLTQKQMAERIDVSEDTVQNWERDRSAPPRKKVEQIAKLFNVSMDWLLTCKTLTLDDSDFFYVPLLDEVRAAAGEGAFVDNEASSSKIAFRRDWIKSHNLTSNMLSAIHVTGDSMSPTLLGGDILLVDMSVEYQKTGCIYVVYTSDGLIVKRYIEKDGSEILLRSDNPLVGEKRVDLADGISKVVGRVVWYGRNI